MQHKLHVKRASLLTLACVATWCLVSVQGLAEEATATPASAAEKQLFAVEFRTGPQWVAGKPPNEQEYFREHSANLRALREQGSLVLGARYSDIGLIVLAAESAEAARAMIDQDPAVRNGTFSYQLHAFSVFYGGTVQAPGRK